MKKRFGIKLMSGALVVTGALLPNTAPALAQDYGAPTAYDYAAPRQVENLVQRIALYPDPLLAQIFAAAAYPDQIAAAAQGAGGPFDASVEALMQYPSVLQMMASDPGWTDALSQALMQDEGAVMDAIQNLRREAQEYGYLQSGPQMQVVDDGGYIGIEPVGGYLYVPMYDPYIVFARPRPGFFVGGAIRFGGGFRFSVGYNRFDWGHHEVFVNRRVWTPPVRRDYRPQRGFEQRPFVDNRRGFTGGNHEGNRPPAMQPPVQQHNFAPVQPPVQQRNFTPRPNEQRNFTPRPNEQRNFTPVQPPVQQRNFTPAQPPVQQRNFAPPQRQMEQRSAPPQPRMEQHNAPQPRNSGDRPQRGGDNHGRGHGR